MLVIDSKTGQYNIAPFVEFLELTDTMTKLPILSLLLTATALQAQIVINEIADKGTSNVCNGKDWIELHNQGPEIVDLGAERYMLHDDKGISDEDAFSFPKNSTIGANGYLLLCTKQKVTPNDESDATAEEEQELMADPMSPQFGISSSDTVTLIRIKEGVMGESVVTIARSSAYDIIDFVVLPESDNNIEVTYAINPDTGLFNYTSTPTPGAANIITRLLTKEERVAAHKQKLKEQESVGRDFFDMDARGYPVPDSMDTVLELKITMTPLDYEYIMKNQTFEEYRPWQSAKLLTTDGAEIVSLDSPGRVRPKVSNLVAR